MSNTWKRRRLCREHISGRPPGGLGIQVGRRLVHRRRERQDSVAERIRTVTRQSYLVRGSVPAWAPDGSRLAFVASVGSYGGEAIWTVAADGSDPEVVASEHGARGPVWSPDGSFIAFEADGDIYLAPAEGGGKTRVTRDQRWDGGPITWRAP